MISIEPVNLFRQQHINIYRSGIYRTKSKRKFEKTGVVKELRARQQYDKPSVLKRLKMEHAIYVQQLRANEE